jgi:hypothetical protein
MLSNRMHNCNTREELAIGYLLAIDAVKDAQRERDWAVTRLQQECAATRFYRVEAHRMYALGELLSHCERHCCAPAHLDVILEERTAAGPSSAVDAARNSDALSGTLVR